MPYVFIILMGFALLSNCDVTLASPHGTEFGSTQFQSSGGMSGAGSARPQDIDTMIFSNPATLAQLKARTAFSAGVSYLHPDVVTHNDGSNPFIPAISAQSNIDTIIFPSFSFATRVGEHSHIGVGFTTLSGLMADYRQSIVTTPVISSLHIFGFGLSMSHQVNSKLSVGVNTTLTGANFQFGLVSNTASVTDFSASLATGATYQMSSWTLGGTFKPAYSHTFKGLIESQAGTFQDFELEQPQELLLSLVSTDSFSDSLLIALDVRRKNWSDAQGYASLWKDQTVISVGAQKTIGSWKYRLGFSDIGGLLKNPNQLGNNLGSITSFNIPGVATLPVSPPLLQLLQSTATNGYWSKHFSLGLSKEFSQNAQVNMYLGYSFDGKQEIAPGLSTDAKVLSLGSGVIWNF